MSLTVLPIPFYTDNYAWTFVDGTHQEAIVIDPGFAPPVLSFLQEKNLSLKAIFITHHHADHIGGVKELKKVFECPVFGPQKSHLKEITHPLKEGDMIALYSNFPSFKILELPGHTLDHIGYLSDAMLFPGDTLFSAGCGRLFEGTPKEMTSSLTKIRCLKDDINVYPAHEYTLSNLRFAVTVEPNNEKILQKIEAVKKLHSRNIPSLPSSIREEKEINPFLRCDQPEVIKTAEKYAKRPLESFEQVFKVLRDWKDHF